MKYFIGDNVKYEGDIWRIFKINGDVISITNGSSEVEVLEGEVEVIYDMDFEPYDYGYMLDNERQMLRKMYDYFCESSIRDYSQILSKLEKLINLLNIILDYDYPLSYLEKEDSKGLLIKDVNWIINVYVNKRNSRRFVNFDVTNPVFRYELRKQKAWLLYHKMRYYYLQQIWE